MPNTRPYQSATHLNNADTLQACPLSNDENANMDRRESESGQEFPEYKPIRLKAGG